MNTKRYSTSVDESTQTQIKYVYLLVKTLVSQGKLKKKRFYSGEHEGNLVFEFKKERCELWVNYDTQKNAAIYLHAPLWDVDKEPVFNFFPEETELQYLNQLPLLGGTLGGVDWITQLERWADNNIETQHMRRVD